MSQDSQETRFPEEELFFVPDLVRQLLAPRTPSEARQGTAKTVNASIVDDLMDRRPEGLPAEG